MVHLAFLCMVALLPRLLNSFRLIRPLTSICDTRLQTNSALHSSRVNNDIVLGLATRGEKVFDFVSSSQTLNKDEFLAWETAVNELATDLRKVTKRDNVLSTYSAILKAAAPKVLDTLQLTSFELFANALIDNLVSMYPDNAPITLLIDAISKVHFEFIDSFSTLIRESYSSSDKMLQSSKEEYLSYQFAGLMLIVYGRVIASLGDNYETSAQSQQMRLNIWVEPILKQLEVAFPQFREINVEERLEQMNSECFDNLLSRISIDVTPRYTLENVKGDSSTTSDQQQKKSYPVWEYANFISKLARNTFTHIDLNTLESKMNNVFLSGVSSRMQRIGRPLEKLLHENELHGDRGKTLVEEMLNYGHSMVGAVFVLWHIRHNIVGVMNENGERVKDYLLPMTLESLNKTIESLPKRNRFTIVGELELLQDKYTKSGIAVPPKLQAASAICQAIRDTASEEFRAIIIYNCNSEEWPDSRDDVYQAVLQSFIYNSLLESLDSTAESSINNGIDQISATTLENMISLAVLDECIGVREPRLTITKAFVHAMEDAVQYLSQSEDSTEIKLKIAEKLSQSINIIDTLLTCCLRFPQGSGQQCRQTAFRGLIDSILSTDDGYYGVGSSSQTLSSFKRLDSITPFAATAFNIDMQAAKAYVAPLGISKYDKVVGSMLLNSDLAVSLPEMGPVLETHLLELADDILLDRKQAMLRVIFISRAVMQSFLETLLEENRRLNLANIDAVLSKAYYLSRHPLLIALQNRQTDADLRELLPPSIKATSTRLGSALFIELVRAVEVARQRITAEDTPSSSSSGWGGGSSTLSPILAKDPQFKSFLMELQTAMLKEYSADAMRKSFRGR